MQSFLFCWQVSLSVYLTPSGRQQSSQIDLTKSQIQNHRSILNSICLITFLDLKILTLHTFTTSVWKSFHGQSYFEIFSSIKRWIINSIKLQIRILISLVVQVPANCTATRAFQGLWIQSSVCQQKQRVKRWEQLIYFEMKNEGYILIIS